VHSSPDSIGYLGESDYESGVNPANLAQGSKNGFKPLVSQATNKFKTLLNFKFTEEMEDLKSHWWATRAIARFLMLVLKIMQVLESKNEFKHSVQL